jgi:hypothetical protein
MERLCVYLFSNVLQILHNFNYLAGISILIQAHKSSIIESVSVCNPPSATLRSHTS